MTIINQGTYTLHMSRIVDMERVQENLLAQLCESDLIEEMENPTRLDRIRCWWNRYGAGDGPSDLQGLPYHLQDVLRTPRIQVIKG